MAAASTAVAADPEWTGLGAGALWNAAGNWTPAPPAAADTAVLGSGFASGISIFRFPGDTNPDALRINAGTDFQLMGSTLGLGSGALTREAGASGLHTFLMPVDLNPNGGPATAPAVWDVQGSGQLSVTQTISTGGRIWQVHAGTFGQATAPLNLAASVDGRLEASGEIAFQGFPAVASLYSTAGLNLLSDSMLSVTGPLPVTLAGGTVRGPGTLDVGGASLNKGTTPFTGSPSLRMAPAAASTTQLTGTGITGLNAFTLAGSGTLRLATSTPQAIETNVFNWTSGGLDLNGHELRSTSGSVTLGAANPLMDTASGGGGHLVLGGDFTKTVQGSVSGRPDITLLAPQTGTNTVTGNFSTAGGLPEIGELTLAGPAALDPSRPRLLMPPGSRLSVERLTVSGVNLVDTGDHEGITVSEGITLMPGAKVEANLLGLGTDQVHGWPVVRLNGGTVDNRSALPFPSNYAFSDSSVNVMKLILTNDAAHPVTIGGTERFSVFEMEKSASGKLTLETDVLAGRFHWAPDGGEIDLHGHELMVAAASTLPVGPNNPINGTMSGSKLTLLSATMAGDPGLPPQNGGILHLSGRPDVDLIFGEIEASTNTWRLGHLSIKRPPNWANTTSFLGGSIDAKHLTVEANARLETPVTGGGFFIRNLEGITFGAGSHATETMEITKGRIQDDGVTFHRSQTYFGESNSVLYVGPTAATPVIFSGAGHLQGLDILQTGGTGEFRLESDLHIGSLDHRFGSIDLNGQTIELAVGSSSQGRLRDSSATGNGQIICRSFLTLYHDGPIPNTPDLTMQPAAGIGRVDLVAVAAVTGLGTFKCDTTAANLNIEGHLGAECFHLVGSAVLLDGSITAEREIILGTGTTLARGARPVGGSIFPQASLNLRGGRLINHGVSLTHDMPIAIISAPGDGSTIEGTEALYAAALSITGTGRTTLSIPVNSSSLALSEGTIDLSGRTMSSPDIGLYDGVLVENTGGAAGALISGNGSPITLRSGRISADMQPMAGLTKNGNDTFTMAGSISAFGGVFNIFGGTVSLEANFATGNIPVFVKNGAALAGAGTVNGLTTVESGGKLSPNSQMIMARPTLMAGSVMEFDLGTPVTGSDTIVLPGGVTGPTDGGKATVNIRRAPGYTNGGATYTLLDASPAGGLGLSVTDYILGTAPAGGALAVVNHKLLFIPAVDTDGDGMEDNWELANFSDLTSADRTTDRDGDGFLDLYEYAADTDPNDPNSLLKITSVAHSNQTTLTTLTFTSKPGQRYRLENSTDLQTWALIYDIDSAAAGFTTTTSGLAPLGDGSRTFYRVTPLLPEL